MDSELLITLRWVAAALFASAGCAVIAFNFVWRAQARRAEHRAGPSMVPLVAPILIAIGAVASPSGYTWLLVALALALDPGSRVLWLAVRLKR